MPKAAKATVVSKTFFIVCLRVPFLGAPNRSIGDSPGQVEVGGNISELVLEYRCPKVTSGAKICLPQVPTGKASSSGQCVQAGRSPRANKKASASRPLSCVENLRSGEDQYFPTTGPPQR